MQSTNMWPINSAGSVKTREFQTTVNFKQPLENSNWLQQKSRLLGNSKIFHKNSKVQRRDIPFQQPYLEVQIQNESEVSPMPDVTNSNQQPLVISKLPVVKPLIKPNETEAERAERIHKSFERLLTFVEIVGQVDNYVSSKWKNLVKTVSNFYEVEDEPYRVSAKQIYGSCLNAQNKN